MLVCLALGLGAASAQTDAELRRAVEAANRRFTAALNRGDVAAAVEVYDDDAIILAANREPVTGRAALRAH